MSDMMYILQGFPPMKGWTSQSQENTTTEPLDHLLKLPRKIMHSVARKMLGLLGKCVICYHRYEMSTRPLQIGP